MVLIFHFEEQQFVQFYGMSSDGPPKHGSRKDGYLGAEGNLFPFHKGEAEGTLTEIGGGSVCTHRC